MREVVNTRPIFKKPPDVIFSYINSFHTSWNGPCTNQRQLIPKTERERERRGGLYPLVPFGMVDLVYAVRCLEFFLFQLMTDSLGGRGVPFLGGIF